MEKYNEIQKFRQWWLWLILLFLPILVIILNYMAEKTFIIESLIVLLFFLPFIWFFYVLNLETTIDKTGIHLTFKPFLINYKLIKFEDIEKIKVITYNPIMQCGGWGLKWYKNGNAINVSGNQGIEIILKNNNLILIGTQKPELFLKSFESFKN